MGCGKEDVVKGVGHHDNCICEVVRAIKAVQGVQDETDCDDCITDCFITPLGGLVSPTRGRINTRVFMLLTDDGDPFKAMFKRSRRRRHDNHHHHNHSGSRDSLGPEQGNYQHKDNCFSVFFRVQNVYDNCCATLQVLEPRNSDGHRVDIMKHGKIDHDKLCDVENFRETDSCITVNLKCFCGVQCIKDVFIDCDRD